MGLWDCGQLVHPKVSQQAQVCTILMPVPNMEMYSKCLGQLYVNPEAAV